MSVAVEESELNSIPVSDLKLTCLDVRPVIPEPMWDLTVFCRFLAARLPDAGAITAPDVARHAEELIEDLHGGVDRQTGKPFSTSMLNGRGDLVYNYFRTRLIDVGRAIGDEAFAEAVRAELRMVEPAAAAPADAATGAPAAAPAKPAPPAAKETPATPAATETPATPAAKDKPAPPAES
jgi:hypothetical protein